MYSRLFLATAGSMKELRERLHTEEKKAQWASCVSTPIGLLRKQMERLSLKENAFKTYSPVDSEEHLWEHCLRIEPNLQVLHYI